MGAGCADEAAAALAEARQLEPDAPENAVIERLIVSGPAPLEPTGTPAHASRKTFAAAVVLMMASAAGGWLAVSRGVLGMGAPAVNGGAVAVPPARSGQVNAPEVQPVSTLTVARALETQDDQGVDGSAAGDREAGPAGPEATPQPLRPETLPGIATSGSEPPFPAVPTASGPPSFETPAPRPLPLEPVAPGAVATGTAAAATAAPLTPGPPESSAPPARMPGDTVPVTPPAPVVDETRSIRAVLMRYETAYSSLDAASVGEVWPQVDHRALSRAFESLESQRVSLGRCEVTVNGTTARAECAGSATWRPKVGGGAQTQPRSWNFELARQNETWLIRSARVK